MNVCKLCMSGTATENSILLSVLPRLNKICNQSINHKVAILLFHSGDLVSLITFEGTIFDQAVSCFSGKNLPFVFQRVMYLYFKNVRCK